MNFLVEVLATKDLTYKQKGHKTMMAEFEIDSWIFLQLQRNSTVESEATADYLQEIANRSLTKNALSSVLSAQYQADLLSGKMQA